MHIAKDRKTRFFQHENAVVSQDCRVTRQGFCAAMVHTALAGTVSIVANRPCLPTHYKLYATLQVTHLFKRPELEGNRESIPGQGHVITAHPWLITRFEI
jgi:hypothetical protein